MTARKLTRAALALLFISVLASCSAVVDPTTGKPQGQKMQTPPAEPAEKPEHQAVAAAPAASSADTAELERLRRENQTLKVQQAEAQARLDTLTKQMAQEREEQRRFREMMTTNFDLLEQSVAKSLADNMERNGRKPEPAAAAKAEPKANKTGEKAIVPGPAMAPPPATTESAAPAQESGPAALQPMPYWDEQGAKEPPASSAAKFDPKRPEAAPADTGLPPRQAAAMTKPAAPAQPSTAKATPAVAAAVPVAMTAPGKDGAAFNDPDLVPPANPRTLSAHPEAKPVYEKGFVQFAKGDYAESTRIFEEFVTRFPDDLHTDNAQFWIGEAHLQLKDTAKADEAFRGVLRHFAHKSTLEGYKTPDAIYKLGQIALMKNDARRAEYYFRNVAERFPDSTAGKKALKEMDSIRVNTAAGTGASISPEG